MLDNDPRRQRLVVLVKDNGQPPLSATASIMLSVVDSVPESLPDFGDLALSPQYRSNLTLYLIVSLGAVSFTFLVAIIVLATIKGLKDRNSCCGFHSNDSESDVIKKSNLNIHISPGSNRPAHCVEVNGSNPIGQNYCYKMCLTPESSKSDFMFLKPCSPTGTSSRNNIKEMENKTLTWSPASHSLGTRNGTTSPNELKQGNKDQTLTKNQLNYTYKSHTSINTGRTLQRRLIQDSDNYAYTSVPQYWTWGNHMHVSPWRPQGAVIEEIIPRSSDKGSLVTKVIALDADSMQNSRITYQFLQITDTTLFSLDQYNGEIRTTRMFSYRDPRQQRLVIIARDNGDPPRSATVTIKISTVEQVVTRFTETTEVPIEYDLFTDLNLYLLIGLGSVLFLLLITVLVIIVLKCQEPKPSQAAHQGRNSIVSQRNSSTIADSTLISSDAYWYSLFLAETRKGKVVVRQPLPNGAGFIVSSIPGSAALTETSASRSSTLQEDNVQ
ncbi:protocadherin alpha-C2-like protein [Labeo rohita]|uniref:Protocadherin alpha-C2-like protein n=1 Tax=Labeo rohita TaxID=84645 RepID=A0A498MJ37_LABRO|nr:protocadherin alpha-C2-like protein [Labeo rohita]